jgi:hypothetical protein
MRTQPIGRWIFPEDLKRDVDWTSLFSYIFLSYNRICSTHYWIGELLMMKRWLMPLIMIVALPSLVFVSGCGDDEDNPIDPNKGYQQVNIRLHAGDQFTYDRWELDENNQKIESSKSKYEIKINKGSGNVGLYSDWFSRIGTDRTTDVRDTLYIRTETRTRTDGTAYTEEVMAYGFLYKMAQQFIATVMELGNVGVPTIPAEQWDVIARYYDTDGTALDPGAEWEIGPEGGITMNFTINGTPLSVEATMTGKLEAREEKIMANGKELTTWKSSVTASFNLLGSVDLDLKLMFWFSDDPDAQVRVVQESANTTIPLINLPFSVKGETQELVSWI